MKICRWAAALLLGFCSLSVANADDAVKLPTKERFHLYLLIGQSNMAGRGKVEDVDKVPHPRVLMLTKDLKWAPAVDPLHFDKTSAGVGLGSSFGRAMAEANPDVTIGLIPSAVGGTPLGRWEKNKDLYKQGLERAQAAMKSGTLKGILWHQGESDSGRLETAQSYSDRLSKMVVDLRAELGAGDVPFVAGKLGEFLSEGIKDGKPTNFNREVNKQIGMLPEKAKNTAVVESSALVDKGDKVHFDSPSLREFGKRYAAAMQKLQSGK